MKVCPAIVTEPERAPPVFGATETFTVPVPLPIEPLVTVIHGALLVLDQAQPPPLVMVVVAAPPAAATSTT